MWVQCCCDECAAAWPCPDVSASLMSLDEFCCHACDVELPDQDQDPQARWQRVAEEVQVHERPDSVIKVRAV